MMIGNDAPKIFKKIEAELLPLLINSVFKPMRREDTCPNLNGLMNSEEKVAIWMKHSTIIQPC